MSTLRFTLRIDKADRFNKCPIELIYQISGQRKKIFTNNKLHRVNWDEENQRGIYKSPAEAKRRAKELGIDAPNKDVLLLDTEIEDINNDISLIKSQIANIEKRFELDGIRYSSESVVNKYKENKVGKTIKADNSHSVYHFIDQYINDHSAVRKAGTLATYKALQSDMKQYQDKTKEYVKFEAVDYGFFQRFQNFLISTGKLNNSTIAKKLSILKTLLSYARKSGIKINDRYRDFTIKRSKIEVIALTQEEFDKLLSKDFSKNKKLDRVRDVFCFSCATGLRMSDMAQLKREHIKVDAINLVVQKTEKELTIPLNKISAAILHKYKDLHTPLPIISNQKLNEYIKDAAKEAEINEPIEIVRFKGSKRETTISPKYKLVHIHTGRKTFCTLSLEKGMSAEQVMSITGHTDYKSFKKYVDVTEKLKKVVMVKAWGEVPILKVV
jgi:site-specific recombinase XerD